MGPVTANRWLGSGAKLTRPRVVLIPKTPQKDEGMRMEPPPSLPTATGHSPAARAAPAPPEEPPGVRSGSQGLWAQG